MRALKFVFLTTMMAVSFGSAASLAATEAVGHRATMLFAPENTLAAIEKAIELGATSIELDVRQTRDGAFVIMHDATVDRTTDGTGAVRELSLAEIKSLDAGIKFGAEYQGERVPTLSEALAALRGRAKPDIDFKEGELANLRKVLETAGLSQPFSGTFLGSTEQMIEVRRWNVLEPRPTSSLKGMTLEGVIKKTDARVINVPELQFSKPYINEIRRLGRKSFVNVILNRPFEEARLRRVAEARPDYIQTDRLDLLIPILKELESQTVLIDENPAHSSMPSPSRTR
ncbi:MAG TPA: glycerophosphodiester phosphodiesterase family protein [Bdellovibrionales bacterium]|nr:glycerophosphodiester phosphodiesterase family protein [Bdellovibrionales bacterium]